MARRILTPTDVASIREARDARSLSLRELAKQTHISRRVLEDLEAGRRVRFNEDTLTAVCRALGLGLSQLGKPHRAAGVSLEASTFPNQASTAERLLVYAVNWRGAEYRSELSSQLDLPRMDAVLRSCCTAGWLVVRPTPHGDVVYHPLLGVLAELAHHARALPEILGALGIPSHLSSSDVLLPLNLRVDLGDRTRIIERHYDLVVVGWRGTLADEADYDDRICESLARGGRERVLSSLLSSLEHQHSFRWYDYFHLARELGLSDQSVRLAHKRNAHVLSWRDGAREFIELVKNRAKLGVITNCERRSLDLRLSALGGSSKQFTYISTSDQHQEVRSKENAIRDMVERARTTPARTLVLSSEYERVVQPALALGCDAGYLLCPGSTRSRWGSPTLTPPFLAALGRKRAHGLTLPTFAATSLVEAQTLLGWT